MSRMADTLDNEVYEYVCNDCGHCNNDREVLAYINGKGSAPILRCSHCGSRDLSKHFASEGWDYPEGYRPRVASFPTKCLRLVDLIPYLPSSGWSTVIRRTGELSNPTTYTYPERFKVVKLENSTSEGLLVIVDEF